MSTILNASTSSGLVQTADTSGTLALQSNGTTQFTVSSTGAYGQLKSGTAVSASSTSVDFTSIPSWVKRITVMFQGVSTNGTSLWLVQIGSGSVTSSSYVSGCQNGTTFSAGTAGFVFVNSLTASDTLSGSVVLALVSSNTWTQTGAILRPSSNCQISAGTSPALSGALDRVRITTVNGTDTFDAGSINIMYEG